MAESIEEWIESHVKKYQSVDVKKMYNHLFFRDEYRPIYYDPMAFYSGADGVIIYQQVVKPGQKLLEVKGKKYTVGDILMDKELPNKNYWVIGVFMTLYDVHLNRMPTDGLLRYELLDSIESYNMPMIFMEKGLFANDLNYKTQDHNYLFNNERMCNEVLYMKKGIKYYAVQIADMDVNTITHFSQDNPDNFSQGERFSFIRWGSQFDIIVPEHPKYKFEFVQKPMFHVKAGVDKVLKITEK
jgi:phosphatidylserine decarboxylase